MSKAKPISAVIDAAHIGARPQAEPRQADAMVKRLFMLFHGWYGNLLIARYQTGDTGLDGKDRGVASAMKVWQSELARFEPEDVEAAAARCQTDHPKYPPTLPEFVALCKAVRVRPMMKVNGTLKVEMSEGLRSSYTAKARAQAMHRYRANLAAEVGMVNAPDGARGLQVLIAQAVALAGGDEVQVLRRYDRTPIVRFTPRRAA